MKSIVRNCATALLLALFMGSAVAEESATIRPFCLIFMFKFPWFRIFNWSKFMTQCFGKPCNWWRGKSTPHAKVMIGAPQYGFVFSFVTRFTFESVDSYPVGTKGSPAKAISQLRHLRCFAFCELSAICNWYCSTHAFTAVTTQWVDCAQRLNRRWILEGFSSDVKWANV